MKKINKDIFINKASKTLANILDSFNDLEVLNVEDLVGEAALIIIDMNNGFAKKGALYSERVEALIPEVSNIAHSFNKNKEIPIIIVNENHPKDSMEFKAYPPHCIAGTKEAEIIKELEDIDNKIVIGKNCTNAFVVEEFRETFMKLYKKGIKKFVIIGDCTDICIYQAAVSMQAYFINNHYDAQVIVPIYAVDTYDIDEVNHNGDLMNVVFLYSMIGNGVKVVKK
ncbi:cysteine hydrolase family protein [Defluviitalea phaphyphila]|uniref:cysteine hydrolase family protein n=1 Tax=Defluviitalea phaphyphila TaxID=1473580 RepID=UPI0007313CA8|nr:isochorismatase family cysteine hydrolase [Defluviitalea phaphyphila]